MSKPSSSPSPSLEAPDDRAETLALAHAYTDYNPMQDDMASIRKLASAVISLCAENRRLKDTARRLEGELMARDREANRLAREVIDLRANFLGDDRER